MTLDSVILRTAATLLLPLFLLISVYLLIRGHNDPGGGFAGGLLLGAGYILYGVAWGPSAARRILKVEPATLIGAGLGVAALSGLFAMIDAGDPFLAGRWVEFTTFDGALVKLGTPLLFDIGVYLLVAGISTAFVFHLQEAETPARLLDNDPPSDLAFDPSVEGPARPDHSSEDGSHSDEDRPDGGAAK